MMLPLQGIITPLPPSPHPAPTHGCLAGCNKISNILVQPPMWADLVCAELELLVIIAIH